MRAAALLPETRDSGLVQSDHMRARHERDFHPNLRLEVVYRLPWPQAEARVRVERVLAMEV